MAHVLIGFAEALPAAEVVFSLLSAGHSVSAFGRSDRLPLRFLRLSELRVIPAPEVDAVAAADALRTLMQSEMDGAGPPDLFLPLDDAGLWIAGAAGLAPEIVAGAVGMQAEIALDKDRQIKFARAAGLAVPPTLTVGGQTPEDHATALPVPAIAKPARAVSVSDGQLEKGETVYLSSAEALHAFLEKDGADAGPWLVQALIAGRGEGLFGFATEHGVVAWSGHTRLRMMNPHGSGSSACAVAEVDPWLRERAEVFIRDIGWRGPFMIEFLRDREGTHWFMELNGRMWGSMALARRQGFEYPAWAVALAEDGSFVPATPPAMQHNLVVRHLGRDILHLLFVLRGPKAVFHQAMWPSFWGSLAAVLRPARASAFYNYDPAFPRYFLRDAAWTVKRVLFR